MELLVGIFSNEAPKYWVLGKPAIPLRAGFKNPWIEAWQVYADRTPNERERQLWLNTKGNGNIGLPMGAASGIVAIDVDSDDPRVQRIIEQLLRSHHGAVLAVRAPSTRSGSRVSARSGSRTPTARCCWSASPRAHRSCSLRLSIRIPARPTPPIVRLWTSWAHCRRSPRVSRASCGKL